MQVSVDGKTKRERLEQVAKTTGKKPKSLIPPPLPDEAFYLWEWYVQIYQLGGDLSLANMDAWSRLFGEKPTQEEIQVLYKIEKLRNEIDRRNR